MSAEIFGSTKPEAQPTALNGFNSNDSTLPHIKIEHYPKMTEKKVTAGDGVSFVLEINSGLVEEFEIDASWIMNFTDFFETTKPFC